MGESTTIAGDAISELCVRYASMLSLEIYDTIKADLPARLHPYWDINKERWDLAWGNDDADGYRMGFYTPKAVADQDPATLCPPVLIFRGSDTDFQGLACAYSIDASVLVEMPIGGGDDISETFSDEGSKGLSDAYNGKTFAQMRTLGLHEEPMFTNVSGTETFDIAVPWWPDATVTITWRVSASLFYGTDGDWAVNFAQGLGVNIPAQYTKAIRDGQRAGTEAANDWNNRLIVTGHSLGGGLASAAAIAIRTRHPDMIMQGATYNAAGLHENTAQLAGGTRDTASQVPIRAVHVKDEVLNSMQSRSRLVPFIADLLVWGGKSMPSAIANPTPQQGTSPGPMPISGVTFANEMDLLPNLYTVDRQAVGPAMTEINQIIAIANSSNTVEAFVRRLIAHLIDRLSVGDEISKAEVDDLKRMGGVTISASVLPGIQAAIITSNFTAARAGTGVPQMTLSGSAYISGRLQEITNGLIMDSVTIARVLLASGEYHTFIPCAYTFLLPRGGPR